MGYGVSLILIAVGAILAWGVSATVTGINIHAVGAILMVVGVIGLAMTLLFWSSFSPLSAEERVLRRGRSRSQTVVDDGPDVIVDRRGPTTVIRESSEPTVVVRDQTPRYQ